MGAAAEERHAICGAPFLGLPESAGWNAKTFSAINKRRGDTWGPIFLFPAGVSHPLGLDLQNSPACGISGNKFDPEFCPFYLEDV
jgi:hypothetical protein